MHTRLEPTARPQRLHEDDKGPRRTPQPAWLLAGTRAGLSELPRLLAHAIEHGLPPLGTRGPLPLGAASEVLQRAEAQLGAATLPEEGMGAEAAIARVSRVLFQHGLDLTHPAAAAHLQPPTLCVSVAADALASISNASLDTYDSGPSGIAIERWLIDVLRRLAGFGPGADGVMTPGGSLSNLLALLLARDAIAAASGIDARQSGVAGLSQPVVLCSELAHFSVQRACAALGLGEGAVHALPVDARQRIDVRAAERMLASLSGASTPVAIVATAGTTDFGSIDPLHELSQLAAQYRCWLHVDAAYGFGALFSERLRSRLSGIERADSVTLDLHKLGWQPAAASVLLLRDARGFGALAREVPYLNPSDDAAHGLDGLLGRSLQTTRRADAVKVVASLLAYGRRGIGDLVEHCHDLARHAEARVRSEPELELVAPVQLTTVVFRYRYHSAANSCEDELNGSLRRALLESGSALIGRTQLDGRVCLKLTLLNPSTTRCDIDALFDRILQEARKERVA